MNTPSIDRYLVMGNPVAHSKSPIIHRMFAEQTDQALEYDALLVETDDFAKAVDEFRQTGGLGCNVTVPFKQEAWKLAEKRSDRAQRAGAVNTLKFESDQPVFGDNTDGIGLLRDLQQNLELELEGCRVLVLGAGGAVRGILEPLLLQNPDQVVIGNRTQQRAEALAHEFSSLGVVLVSALEDLQDGFDLIINGTAASLQGKVPELPEGLVHENSFCYDMMYAPVATAFQSWADQHRVRNADGLGMLVEQAAESFQIWRGVQPQTRPVIRALRAAMCKAAALD